MLKRTLLISFLALITGLLSFSFRSTPVDINHHNIVMDSTSFAEVFPTNFTDEMFIKGESEPDVEIRVEVFDLSGLLVRTFVLEAPLNAVPLPLNMSGLANEGFIVRVYEKETLLLKDRVFKK